MTLNFSVKNSSVKSSISTFLIIVSTIPIYPLSASARISASALKGLNEVINPQYQDLSPVYGCIDLQNHVLENIYRYGGSDPVSKLVRDIFNIPPDDQTTFQVTRREDKLASHLTPQLVGEAIRALRIEISPENLRSILSPQADEADHEKRKRQQREKKDLEEKINSIFEKIRIYGSKPTFARVSEIRQQIQKKKSEITLFQKDLKSSTPADLRSMAEKLGSLEDELMASELIPSSHQTSIGQGTARLFTGERTLEFQDCYESTLQNLTNMMLRSPGEQKMNIERLKKRRENQTLLLS